MTASLKLALLSANWTRWEHRLLSGGLRYADAHPRIIVRPFAPYRSVGVAVEELRSGNIVWTADPLGRREVAVVLDAARVPAPPRHQVIHLVLHDGRELWASPGHPTADGRRLADLRTGDVVDGGRVETTERVDYEQAQTYDLLTSGWTGYYWANGILLGSTLKKP